MIFSQGSGCVNQLPNWSSLLKVGCELSLVVLIGLDNNRVFMFPIGS